jgi:hypothetical protein
MVREKGYYSDRTGKHPEGSSLTLARLGRAFLMSFKGLEERGYFQESLGVRCIDDPDSYGTLGPDVAEVVAATLRKDKLWPLNEGTVSWFKEEDLFDVIEFLFDHVSKGLDGHYHSYNQCGTHFNSFDAEQGKAELRRLLNPFLANYGNGFELSQEGEIRELPEQGMDQLLSAQLPEHDPENVNGRVDAAVNNFRRRKSSLDDRKAAVRELADVLEFLRPKLKDVLNRQDESDLFNIANNFGIRHHRPGQKTDYDPAIWLSWMFYYYLATIHAAVRLIERAGGA